MSITPQIHALIPCAGNGSRSGASIPKQYQSIAGHPMLWHTLSAFAQCQHIASILLVLAPDDVWFSDHTCPHSLIANKLHIVRKGGASRGESVQNGLKALQQFGAHPQDWVLVHDAARCLITPRLINQIIHACENDSVGGLLALPLSDTLKSAEIKQGTSRVATTISRSEKWLAQTPQMFHHGRLLQALESGLRANPQAITDEASAIERIGLRPLLVHGSMQNFKVTYPEDFALAEAVLRARTND